MPTLKNIQIRVKTCWRILTGKYQHYLLVNVDDENHLRLLKGKSFEIDGFYNGLQNYTYFKIIKALAASKDDIDMILEKAQFEADAIEYQKKQK